MFPSLASSGARLLWVSPVESGEFLEYQNGAFLRAVGLELLASQLSKFWPRRGPVWDALAAIENAKNVEPKGILLVEAKSHPPEVYGRGCQASPASRRKIEAALNRTKRWLGVPEGVDWTGRLYQSANRLAHLHFFREIADVPVWLVNVYFLHDPHSPTMREEWEGTVSQVKAELGLTGGLVPYTAEVFLEAREREELVGLGSSKYRPSRACPRAAP